MNLLYDRIPEGLTPVQRRHMERELDRLVCMMIHWFADRAFSCPESLPGTVETYKGLVLQNAHNEHPASCPVCDGPIVGSRLRWVDDDARVLVWSEGTAQLTQQEAKLFDLFWRNRNTARLFDRHQIADHLWGHRPDGGPESALNAVSVIANNIRKKIRRSGVSIVSVRGQTSGYRLEVTNLTASSTQQMKLMGQGYEDVARHGSDRRKN